MKEPDEETKAEMDRLLAEHGSVEAVIAFLWENNHQQREERRRLRKQLDEAGVTEGAVVLSPEEAALYREYEELGDPAELKRLVEQYPQVQAEHRRLTRERQTSAAADLLGWDRKVLASLATKLDIQVQEVPRQHGRKELPTPVPFVIRGEGAEPMELADYATVHWKAFLPALQKPQRPDPPSTPTREFRKPTAPAERPKAKANGIDPASRALLEGGGYSR